MIAMNTMDAAAQHGIDTRMVESTGLVSGVPLDQRFKKKENAQQTHILLL